MFTSYSIFETLTILFSPSVFKYAIDISATLCTDLGGLGSGKYFSIGGMISSSRIGTLSAS